MLTYDLMIPSGVKIENKALQPDIVLKSKKEKKALLIEVSGPSDFGVNNAEIKKTTKYQDLTRAQVSTIYARKSLCDTHTRARTHARTHTHNYIFKHVNL